MENLLSTVFISYNWENQSDKYVDDLVGALKGKAIAKRDKLEIGSWKKISDFMKSIREQDIVVLVISKKYLKSDNCLCEIHHLMKDDDWEKKSLFVIMDSAKRIYNPKERLKYIRLWRKKCMEVSDKKLRKLGIENPDEEKRKKYLEDIIKFINVVADAKNPDMKASINEIVNKAEGQITDIRRELRYLIEITEKNQLEWKNLLEYSQMDLLMKKLENGEIDYGVNSVRFSKSYYTKVDGREYFLMELYHGDPDVTSPDLDTRILMKSEASGLHQYVKDSIIVQKEMTTLQLWISHNMEFNAHRKEWLG